jgi:hypothetical protein
MAAERHNTSPEYGPSQKLEKALVDDNLCYHKVDNLKVPGPLIVAPLDPLIPGKPSDVKMAYQLHIEEIDASGT